MCFDTDSRPPIRPIAGGALDSADLVLESGGGTQFSAFVARADAPTGAGMLVLPDVRGLHAYYRELALRFAEHGVDAMAIDYFGRTAGTGDRGDGFEYMPHVVAATWDGLAADIRTAAATLRGDAQRVRSLFTVGFCMGGRLSFVAATLGLELAGVVGFYGWPTGPSRNGTPAPAEIADRIAAPVLAIFGEADEGLPPAVIATFDAALDAASVAHETVTYPGAPHSFFDKKAAVFAEASADAWSRTLAFVGAHTVLA